MTQIGLNYLQHLETVRANKAKESHNAATLEEDRRHNLVSEVETERSHRADESIKTATLDESIRHNKAYEAETKRSNLAREAETARHNVVSERETQRHNVAAEQETNRHNVRTEAFDERNVAVREKEAEIKDLATNYSIQPITTLFRQFYPADAPKGAVALAATLNSVSTSLSEGLSSLLRSIGK